MRALRERSRSGGQEHVNVGPAERALGFRAEVIDSHAYVMTAFDAPNGMDRDEKLRRLQLELGTHHTFTVQLENGQWQYVGNSSLLDQESMALRNVRWFQDDLGRPCWEVDGKRYMKGNCPPHVQCQGNAYSCEQLLAAMDFADVSISVLHYYPTFGDLSSLHREACQRFPNRFRRLMHFPDLLKAPSDEQCLASLLKRVDSELAAGGVCGLQFFTGWFQGDWDGPAMRPFWDHLAAKGVAIWFTCVLGNPKQFTADAEDLFVADYGKVTAWCKRYPNSDVVLTHGLPWRSYLQGDTNQAAVPERLLEVFQCPRVHLQLLIPLRIGDLFDFPFREANEMLHKLAKSIGVERLLYGTDMPMLERYCTYSQSILHIARYCDFLSVKERALVLGGNAQRLLNQADKATTLRTALPSTGISSLATVRLPAEVGQRLESLSTPCLIIDLDAFEANCHRMNEILRPLPTMRLRPHMKPHKSSNLAMRQLKLHDQLASGVCCQTVREAEVMVKAGLTDVLLTNILADTQQSHRLARLSLGATVGVCVDSKRVLSLLQESLRAFSGASFEVMLELGVACRTGIEPDAVSTTVSLAQEITQTAGLKLRGLQVYHGVAQHLRSLQERQQAVSEAAKVAETHLRALKEVGIPGDGSPDLIVSGGGTGTLPLEASTGIYGELQCGSYIFNDVDYARNKEQVPWQQSLFVLGTVLGSYSRAGAIQGPHQVVDVGLKSVAFDSGNPIPLSASGKEMNYVNLGDEHGAIRSNEELPAGSRIKHIPGHCDPTVNLHDFIIGIRKGVVECIFPVDARGY